MSYVISYGTSNNLSSLYSITDITSNTFTLNGTSIVDTSFNLQLNYSSIPNVFVTYTITAIRLE